MAFASNNNQPLLAIAEAPQGTIEIASNSYHCIQCGTLNQIVPPMEEKFNDVNQFLKKLVDMLGPLQETEFESTKQHIINQINGMEYISLLKAVKNEDINAVHVALNRNDDLEMKDDSGNTSLHISAMKGNADLVNLLIECGADVKSINNKQQIPLHTSCEFGNTNVANIFLEKGVSIDIRDLFGNTPLRHASKNDKGDVVEMLLNQGACYTIKNKDKKTAADELCDWSVNSIKAFLDFNPNLISKQQKEFFLIKASEMNWGDTVESLIRSNVNVNCANEVGKHPLMVAAANGHNSVIEKLLEYGADVITKFKRFSALYYACRHGHLESVKLLLRYHSNNESIVEIYTHILGALREDRHHVVEYLLDLQQNPNAHCQTYIDKKTNLETLLFRCSYYNSYKTAELLLNKRVAIDAVHGNNQTLLCNACENDSEQVVNLLLKRGANVNAKCEKLKNSLHYACSSNTNLISRYNIVKLLLSYKVDTTCKDIDGHTALDKAKVNNLKDIVTILENHCS